jgi:hypothetical protein
MANHNDAIKYIDTINGLKTKAIQANAKINPRDEFKKLVNDVNPVFYLEYIRTVRLKYQSKLEEDNLQEKDIEEIRQYFLNFYKATSKPLKSNFEINFKTNTEFEKEIANIAKKNSVTKERKSKLEKSTILKIARCNSKITLLIKRQ